MDHFFILLWHFLDLDSSISFHCVENREILSNIHLCFTESNLGLDQPQDE